MKNKLTKSERDYCKAEAIPQKEFLLAKAGMPIVKAKQSSGCMEPSLEEKFGHLDGDALLKLANAFDRWAFQLRASALSK